MLFTVYSATIVVREGIVPRAVVFMLSPVRYEPSPNVQIRPLYNIAFAKALQDMSKENITGLTGKSIYEVARCGRPALPFVAVIDFLIPLNNSILSQFTFYRLSCMGTCKETNGLNRK